MVNVIAKVKQRYNDTVLGRTMMPEDNLVIDHERANVLLSKGLIDVIRIEVVEEKVNGTTGGENHIEVSSYKPRAKRRSK